MTDPVNHPKHYTAGKVECIDAIEAAVSDAQGFEGYCVGNAIKYLWRWKHKGGVQDLEKARWYVDRLISSQVRAPEPLIQPDYMDAYDTVEAHQLGRLDRG